MIPVQVFRFNHCEVDASRRELSLHGQPVDLQPLIFDLLLFLLEHANRVVTKEEMLSAVWRSAVVSDSVVARAIMKLRRAIGDDAAQARTLLTVHRVGYRFAAPVHRGERAEALPEMQFLPAEPRPQAAPAQGLAVTAFENLSGDPDVDPLLSELDHVVRHLMGDRSDLAGLGGSDALAAWQGAQRDEDPLGAACANAGVAELAVLSVVRSAGQYTVRVLRGSHSDEAQTLSFTGPNLLVLASRAAEALSAAAKPGGDGEDLDFWQGQYSRVLRLHHQGMHDQALELLQLCRWHLNTTVPMSLVHGRLLLATRQVEAARVQLEAALAGAQGSGRVDLAIEAQLALADWAIAAKRPEDGAHACEQALALIRAHPQMSADAPKVMLRLVEVLVAGGRGPEAIVLAERAVSTAQRIGHRAMEERCRLALGCTLTRFRQLHRAAEAIRRVIDAGDAADSATRLEALFAMAEVERAQHRRQSSLDHARQARALARRIDPAQAGRAHALELDALVHSGQVDQAARMLEQQWAFEGGLDPDAPCWVRRVHALLLWRQGQLQAAEAAMAALLAGLPEGAPEAERVELATELQFMRITLGADPQVADLAQDLSGADPWQTTRLWAARALRDGDRAGAKEALIRAWDGAGSNAWDAFELGVDLAWMLLEDGDHEPLERVIAQVLETTADSGPARLLQQAYLGGSHDPMRRSVEWARLVAEFPSLVRRHPHLAEGFHHHHLTELLSRACV